MKRLCFFYFHTEDYQLSDFLLNSLNIRYCWLLSNYTTLCRGIKLKKSAILATLKIKLTIVTGFFFSFSLLQAFCEPIRVAPSFSGAQILIRDPPT